MKLQESTRLWRSYSLLAFALLSCAIAKAQSTQFTYQGRLTDGGNPANGQYDFQFRLYDTETVGTGSQFGGTLNVPNVQVSGGIFTVQLNFAPCPACFGGSSRFLEIGVKLTSGPTFTTLGPRQPVTSTPYAIRSLNATTADGLSAACVSCVTSSQIQSVQGSQIAGAIPVGSVPAGSGSYIQNTAAQQASSNFNISGNGTAGGTLSGSIVNAGQYNLFGSKVLSVSGTQNLFVGVGAGQSNTTGESNAFFGHSAGINNSSGSNNGFFGILAGANNTTGSNNTFFGTFAGQSNLIANGNAFFGAETGRVSQAGGNSFFGANAGGNNTTGALNAFFGVAAGFHNMQGEENSFFGANAGQNNLTGDLNAFFGSFAGGSNQSGGSNAFFGESAGGSTNSGGFNSFFGRFAGYTNTTGLNNTAVGGAANLGSNSLTNATAIGYRAFVTLSNSLVLGSIAGVNGAAADTNAGIGTTAPDAKLTVVAPQTQVRFGPSSADNGGYLVSTSASQAILSGGANFGGSWVAKSTAASNVAASSGALTFSTNTGLAAGATFTPTERMRISSSGNVGIGTNNPNARLHVSGGSIFVASPNSLIITAPNGSCWSITVSNAGALSANAATCP